MGIFSKLMILTVSIAVITPFFLKGSNGQPLQSLEALNLGAIGQIAANALNKVNPPSGSSNTINANGALNNQSASLISALPSGKGANSFYKWKDENGIWQFTLTPPPNPNLDFSVITTDPNANVIQSLSKQDIAETLGWEIPGAKKDENQAGSTPEIPNIPFPSTIPATDIPKLIEQAKATQQLMNDRGKVLDAL